MTFLLKWQKILKVIFKNNKFNCEVNNYHNYYCLKSFFNYKISSSLVRIKKLYFFVIFNQLIGYLL